MNNKNLGQTNAIKLKVSEVNEGSNGKIERVSMPIES